MHGDEWIFGDIGRLVSGDQHSREYPWRKRGEPICPSCNSPDFYYLKRSRVRCNRFDKDPLKGTRFTELPIFPHTKGSTQKTLRVTRISQETLKRDRTELQDSVESVCSYSSGNGRKHCLNILVLCQTTSDETSQDLSRKFPLLLQRIGMEIEQLGEFLWI
jgi:hypothetical protein